MDYKEKYEKALAYVEDLVAHNVVSKENASKYLSELAESEDEKIIKEILSIVKSYRESCITEGNHRFDDCISWLEKQKPVEICKYPLFTFDDVLALQCCMETAEKVQKDEELYKQLQSLHDRVHDAYHLREQNIT